MSQSLDDLARRPRRQRLGSDPEGLGTVSRALRQGRDEPFEQDLGPWLGQGALVGL